MVECTGTIHATPPLHILNHTLFRSQWHLGALIFIVQTVRLKKLVHGLYVLKDFCLSEKT